MAFKLWDELYQMIWGTKPVSIPENTRIVMDAVANSLLNASKFIEDITTARTYDEDDYGAVIIANNAGAITHTLPNDAPKGTMISVVQLGAGAVTFTPASGASRVNLSSHTKTAGQYSVVTLLVVANSTGTAATWLLVGGTA